MKIKIVPMAIGLFASVVFAAETLPKEGVPAPLAIFNFDRDALRKPPARFTPAGGGGDSRWEVQQDPRAPSAPNVLLFGGKGAAEDNGAVLILDDVMLEHGEAAVHFKTLSDGPDQSAGIFYRYKDSKNYYVITANSRDDMCALYRVKNGKQTRIGYQEVVISPLTWHELRITFADKMYTALIDGEVVLGNKDSSIKGPGLIGLWAKADAGVMFDDFQVSQ